MWVVWLSQLYFVTFCCCLSAGEQQSDKAVSNIEVQTKQRCVALISYMGKKWHPLICINTCWMYVNTVRLWVVHLSCGNSDMKETPCSPQPGRRLQVWHAGSCSWLMKTHSSWWWLCWKIVFYSWEFSLSNSVIVLFDVVSMEIIGRHYFQSNLWINNLKKSYSRS